MSVQAASADPTYPLIRNMPGAFPSTPNNERVISAPQSLSQQVKARKAEYVRKKTINIKVGSWNVAAIKGTEKDLGAWFVGGLGVKGLSEDLAGLSVESSSVDSPYQSQIESVHDQEQRQKKKINTLPKNDIPAVPHGAEVDLYVLGLQEIVDITSATETLRQYTDTQSAKKWIQTMDSATPPGYVKIAEQQLLGLLLLIYASPEMAPTIGSVSTTSVGTGLLGYMGNKGAAAARITLGETTRLVFVNCHLAAGSDKAALERRNWDAGQILSRTKFSPVRDTDEASEVFGETIGEEDFAFWFGDLNYRLADIPGDDVRRLLLLHTRNEYDLSNKSKRKIDSELGFIDAPSNGTASDDEDTPEQNSPLDPKHDPASLHTTLQSLLSHDELRAQQKLRKAFHDGWREGDINFLPTYKYDVGSIGMFDSGEKKRGPSWCDRILYRTRRDFLEFERQAKEAQEARKRDEDMKARGLDEAASEDSVLFDYDPDADGLAYGDDYDDGEDDSRDAVLIQTHEGYEDAISLDHYISHQRVLSSDHKPLDAVFTLMYDSVIPELKAKVHQDVARELDRAENEGRPGVTLVVDDLSGGPTGSADEPADSNDLSGVDFGDIKYGIARTCGLTVANTGRVPASFSFVDRPVGTTGKAGISPHWLEVQVQTEMDGASQEYTLQPGETADIKLIIEISGFELVSQLNAGNAKIDDVLVLRIHNGRDHFIPVRGNWMPSCFCRTLDELVRFGEGGVRGSSSDQTVASFDGASGSRQNDSTRLSAPRELFALTEAIQNLVERALAEWDMTSDDLQTSPWKRDEFGAGWPFNPETWTMPKCEERSELCAAAREALDTSTPFANHLPSSTPSLIRLEVLCETLLLFLQSLRDGIVTSDLWSDMEAQMLAREKAKKHLTSEERQAEILDILSSAPVHSVAFTFLTFMLTRIATEVASRSLPSTSMSIPPRVSMSSPRSSVAESGTTVPAIDQSPTRTSVFPSFRRRNRASTSASSTVESENIPSAASRKAIEHAFARIFAGVMIRSATQGSTKEKDKKTMEDKKMAILEPFLHNPI
jgi:inositol polyphosphate 5-phosphatase INPP5B/F